MQAEQQDISAFLTNTAPFSYLKESLLGEVLDQLEIRYFKSGSPILNLDQPANYWYVIRKGAVEVFRRDGELYNRLGVGGYFGEFGLLMGKKVRFPVKAIEDTLCYVLPADTFTKLFNQCEAFADFVEIEDNTRLKKVAQQSEKSNLMLTAQVHSLIAGSVLKLPSSTPAQEAAKTMTEQGVMSILVCEADDKLPSGIVTDYDLRTRLVAQGLPLDTPLADIMTPHPYVLEHDRPAFEAMMVMLRTGAHHLPVARDGEVLGVVSQTDLVRHQSRSTLFVANHIAAGNSIEELAALKDDVTQAFIRLVEEDANSRMIGTSMACIGRAFKQRLLELAEKEFGPPPVP
ncbi:MAG: cyclic nucleotide-binding domain-containing protein, partial [Limnobacter sp.]|nr:cyclic nucleotide-binding domain-containing protein [Limnobacter sp.]